MIEELAKLVGRSATLTVGELRVEVTVTDVRANFGRTDYLITPVTGSGQAWVSQTSITLEETP